MKGGNGGAQQTQGYVLSDLLETTITIPMIDTADEAYLDNLLNYLPPSILVLAQQGAESDTVALEPSAEEVNRAKASMTTARKKALLKKVLRSPQFHQSLGSLTMAIRDGGLPTVAEALHINVENRGYVRGGTMPLGGGDAVAAFVDGVKKAVEEEDS